MNGHYQIGDTVMQNWVLHKKLGEGSFGKVYEVIREDFGETYRAALKIITVPQSEAEIQAALEILEARLPILPGRENRAILGYSLGGLFALWAFCAGKTFGAAASLSGSLWYEGWTEYLAAHLPEQGGRVYLSLGKKEEKSGPAQMRLVGERTRETAGMFRAAGRFGEVPLEMHGGGHFTDIPGRWRRAMEWLDGEERL